MKKDRSVKPEPVPVNVVCSLCGEPWALHTEIDGEVTTLECIRLLKAARLRVVTPIPMPVYPIYPLYPRPYVSPWWQASYTATGTSTAINTNEYNTVTCSDTQPKVLHASPA